MYAMKSYTKETHSCTSVPCGRVLKERKTLLLVIGPTSYRGAATSVVYTSGFGHLSILMFCLFPLRVFPHFGALFELDVPPTVTPLSVLGDHLGDGYVDGGACHLNFVGCPLCDAHVVVSNGVWPSFDPFSQLGYRMVVVESQLSALNNSAERHQVCMCDDVPTAGALSSFSVCSLIGPSTGCPQV